MLILNHEATTDHNELPQLHVCQIGHVASLNEVQEKSVETDYKRFNNKKLSYKYWVHRDRQGVIVNRN